MDERCMVLPMCALLGWQRLVLRGWSRLDGRTAGGARRRTLKGVGSCLVNKKSVKPPQDCERAGSGCEFRETTAGSSNATRTVSRTTVFRSRPTVFTGRCSQHPSPPISPTKDPKMEAVAGHVVVGWFGKVVVRKKGRVLAKSIMRRFPHAGNRLFRTTRATVALLCRTRATVA
ncbi:hypothetical protein C8R44DRAFT_744748 [Mycena epipterygia]|nr:hypothetical protein C8R44DRAFT_744748 [Mycena epipterygia]